MSNESKKPGGWWKTIPGALTAVAGIITAITGFIVALNQIGVFDDNAEPDFSKSQINEQTKIEVNNTYSTNIDKPKWLSENEIRGLGVGESASHYYTFIAGPGVLKVTADAKNGFNGIANALGVILMNMDAKELLNIHMGNTKIDKRIVERVRLHKQQQIIMRILLDEVTIDYMVRIEGNIDIKSKK